MGLRREVVDLIGLHLLDEVNERGGVGHVAVVQHEVVREQVWVLVDVVDISLAKGHSLRSALLVSVLYRMRLTTAGAFSNAAAAPRLWYTEPMELYCIAGVCVAAGEEDTSSPWVLKIAC